MSLIYNGKTRQWSALQAHAGTHTHLRFTDHIWLFVFLASAPFLSFNPLFHRHSAHLIFVDPCLPRSHTAASPVKRWDCFYEQALPLRSADRALIWRLMPRKRLIKGGRWGRRQGLITASESIPTLWANWPGSEWPAAGQRLGHLMAFLSHCHWVYFYALSPSSLLRFNEPGLVIHKACSKLSWLCSSELPHPKRGDPGKLDVIFFENRTQRGWGVGGVLTTFSKGINWA